MPFFTFRNFLNTLCLLILCTYVVKGQIQGRVINDKQLPIANATVSIKDHNLGTSTDEFGYFTLPDPGPDYGDLVVSAVGYQPHRTTLSDSSDLQSLQIILAEDNLKRLKVGRITKGNFMGLIPDSADDKFPVIRARVRKCEISKLVGGGAELVILD